MMPPVGYNGAFPFSFLICSIVIWKYKCGFKSGFPILRKHRHQENEGHAAQETRCVADAAQCLIELEQTKTKATRSKRKGHRNGLDLWGPFPTLQTNIYRHPQPGTTQVALL